MDELVKTQEERNTGASLYSRGFVAKINSNK